MSPVASVQATHRALADASRVRILQELQGGPLDSPTLAGRVGLHTNTVRAHLDLLEGAGMVTRAPERRDRRGRPRIVYRIVPGTMPGEDDGYRLLAKILAGHLATAEPHPARAAEEAGQAWGRHLVERPEPLAGLSVEQATSRVIELLAELGFAPEGVENGGSRQILLHHCPFRDVVDANQEVVCSVHLGLLRGALREMGAPVEATKLQPLVQPSLCIVELAARTRLGERLC